MCQTYGIPLYICRCLCTNELELIVLLLFRETNSMVEEFMLLANVSVAERISREFPVCAVLRRHPQPAPSNFEPLIKAASLKVISS